jgi:predicted dehydrogenase
MHPGGPIRIAVVGLGYWGPNLVRTSWEVPELDVAVLCDADEQTLEAVGRRYPAARRTTSFDAVLTDDQVDAVVLATPGSTHHAMAREALLAGKHVFVEKPMAETAEQCRALMDLASTRDLTLMPGHTFLYSPPVRKVKELLDSGELGEIFFATFSRVNLGIHQSDMSVVRDLAPHDFSILLHWFGLPRFVRAIGRDSVGSGQLDVAFIDVGLPTGALVHIELSWLAPTKLRRTVLVGSERMVVYEDTSVEQVRVYDRRVDLLEPRTFGEHQLSYRSGDVLTPHLDAEEPLRVQMQDFAAAIVTGATPRSDAALGMEVVRLVEATELSLRHNGTPVPVDVPPGERRKGLDRRISDGGMPRLTDAPPGSSGRSSAGAG